jgi:hypothetical protein
MWAPYAKQTILQDDGKIDTNLLGSEEAARRYYSTKESVFSGKKVFSVKDVRPDKKFLDEGELLILELNHPAASHFSQCLIPTSTYSG